MGAAEAYLGAFVFYFFHAFLGISSFTLRLGMIFLFTLFLSFMYLLTSLLFSKKWALVTLFLLALGSDAILTRELVAVGGDAETLVSGTLILLLATWLSLSVQDGTQRKRRLLAYAGCGLAAGFGIWSHLLVAPFILMGAIILLLFCRREIFNREVLKCFSWPGTHSISDLYRWRMPLIIYNIQHFRTLQITFLLRFGIIIVSLAYLIFLALQETVLCLTSLPAQRCIPDQPAHSDKCQPTLPRYNQT